MEKVSLSAGITAYEDINKDSKKIVVFLHGGTIPSWCYDHTIKHCRDTGVRLIRYDMYGRGESEAPKATYNREFYLKQFEEFLDKLDIKNIDTIVGASFGAAIGTLYSLKNSESVKKIVYISPAVNWIENNKKAKLISIPLFGRVFYSLVAKKLIRKRALGFVDSLPPESAKRYKKLITDQFAPDSSGFWDSLYSQLTTGALGNYHTEYSKLGNLKPNNVYLIWGVGDSEVSQENVDDLKHYFKGISVKDVKGSGHGLMAEFPELVSEYVRDIVLK